MIYHTRPICGANLDRVKNAIVTANRGAVTIKKQTRTKGRNTMDMTPADMRAVLDGGNDGYGMGGGWIIWILLFAALGGNGFGFGGRSQAATTDELSAGFNFAGINNKLDGISTSITSEGRNLDNAICTLGYNSLQQTSALSAQMANCCCDLKTAIHAEGEATRNMIQQDKIESLQAQINNLQLNAALCGVVRYPTATTYATTCNPFFGGYTACGCNTCTNI